MRVEAPYTPLEAGMHHPLCRLGYAARQGDGARLVELPGLRYWLAVYRLPRGQQMTRQPRAVVGQERRLSCWPVMNQHEVSDAVSPRCCVLGFPGPHCLLFGEGLIGGVRLTSCGCDYGLAFWLQLFLQPPHRDKELFVGAMRHKRFLKRLGLS